MPENRISQLSIAANGQNPQPVSPTGAPVLPPSVVPYLVILVAVAGALPLLPGLPPLVAAICGVVVAVGSALGIASPGLRRQ